MDLEQNSCHLVVTGDYPRSSLSGGKLAVGRFIISCRYRGLSPVFVERYAAGTGAGIRASSLPGIIPGLR